MRAKCKRCGDIVEVTRPREFKSCKCGAINLDYGDGLYYRVGGNPEDFDGEIEGVPELKDDLVYRPRAIKADNSMERAMDIIGEENIGGESKPLRKTDLEKFKDFFREYGIDIEPAKMRRSYSDETEGLEQYIMLGEKAISDIHEGSVWCFDDNGNFVLVEEGS